MFFDTAQQSRIFVIKKVLTPFSIGYQIENVTGIHATFFMEIPSQHIENFQTLYQQRFGKEITKEAALEKGLRLLSLMSLVLHTNEAGGVVELKNNTSSLLNNN